MIIAVVSVAYVCTQFVPVEELLFAEAPSGGQVSVRFSTCSGQARVTCVVDGDTIWLHGENIRIADIDTPEVFSPQCPSELARGKRATNRLLELLNAGPIEVVRYGARDEDIYDRKLRVIKRDGRSLGDMLVSEGLARRWDGARHSWCG